MQSKEITLKSLLFGILIFLASCKTIHSSKEEESDCNLIAVDEKPNISSGSFFQTHYDDFVTSRTPGIFWHSIHPGHSKIAIIELNETGVQGRIIGESGYQKIISFSIQEQKAFKSLLSDTPQINLVNDCRGSLPTHPTITNVFIKNEDSVKFIYYSIHSPFLLSNQSKATLGNAYKLLEITSYKMHHSQKL
ncbi:hypothetical protein [Rufibacter hautae]|uniref:Uncharacterized protein n=1 Tax=Rufibacter hautae TaxID=2595005 RepID=A0A5B6TMF3_9BACT|nr:hypothetical protein [Rufibacter hautae]KAA3440547.1 hypothetical protein FOA19_07815 [Rufibacter hautae]